MVIPESMAKSLPGEVKDKQGNTMKVLHSEVDVQDPTMMAVLTRFPNHAVNGMEDPRKPSALVRIPHHTEEAPVASDRPPVDLLGGTSAVEPTRSGGGRLKSLGN